MTLVRSNEDEEEEYSIGVVTYCLHYRSIMIHNLYLV